MVHFYWKSFALPRQSKEFHAHNLVTRERSKYQSHAGVGGFQIIQG